MRARRRTGRASRTVARPGIHGHRAACGNRPASVDCRTTWRDQAGRPAARVLVRAPPARWPSGRRACHGACARGVRSCWRVAIGSYRRRSRITWTVNGWRGGSSARQSGGQSTDMAHVVADDDAQGARKCPDRWLLTAVGPGPCRCPAGCPAGRGCPRVQGKGQRHAVGVAADQDRIAAPDMVHARCQRAIGK